MGGEGDCEELNLELSIGGKYAGKWENLGEKESGCEWMDLQKRREIEARRKRESKWRGVKDDKMFAEAQRCGERARDREIREKEMFNGGEGADELRLWLSRDEKEKKRGNGWLYPTSTSSSDADGDGQERWCVWARGEGPKGRRVVGLLYKYDKKEVSIMCLCHGTSFSPAEFVQHAGGVNVSHPLRHITLLTSSSS